jgi:hypothetical protein
VHTLAQKVSPQRGITPGIVFGRRAGGTRGAGGFTTALSQVGTTGLPARDATVPLSRLPHYRDTAAAEHTLIGACVLSPPLRQLATTPLRGDDFTDPAAARPAVGGQIAQALHMTANELGAGRGVPVGVRRAVRGLAAALITRRGPK